MSQPFHLPPTLFDRNKLPRRAGFEFEFGNLTVIKTANALHQSFGGNLDIINPFKARLTDSTMGTIKIERDQHLLSSVSYRSYFEDLGIDFSHGSIAHEIELNIDNASSIIVPCEVITEPLLFEQLPQLDQLVDTLNDIEALGTQDSLTYAYGMHFNPSVPDTSSETLLAYLQAFLLCSDLIIEESQTDLTRRFLTNFIDPFPGTYIDKVLNINYKPSITKLIDDYMQHNPTRNRSLDMLPIFCEIDQQAVFKYLKDIEKKLVKSRPAFHYRLPDCRLGHPGWTAAQAWNQWIYVEKLATNDELRYSLIKEFPPQTLLYHLDQKSKWITRLRNVLEANNIICTAS